jgi:hypothetical protein
MTTYTWPTGWTPTEFEASVQPNVRQFVSVRTVKGGGLWRGEYLGKVVRWYYATDGDPIISKLNGNKVATTDGARPMMELTDTLPVDTDYARYIAIAAEIILTLGIDMPVNS